MANTELIASKGMFRVIGVDLFDNTDYLVDDYGKKEVATDIADERNRKRTGPMNDVFYVYDDTEKDITDEKVIRKTGIAP